MRKPRFNETNEPSEQPRDPRLASDKQVAFIGRLLDEKQLTASPSFFDATNAMDHEELAAYIAHIKEQVKRVPKARASELIETLLALPNKESAPRAGSALPEVPEGRYAVTGEDGTTDFYRVVKPGPMSRWHGRTFVNRLEADGGYGDDFAERKLSFEVQKTILNKIVEAGIQESMERYGREIGRCGHCGRNLTNAESIERGIGPICAGHMGW